MGRAKVAGGRKGLTRLETPLLIVSNEKKKKRGADVCPS